MSGDTTEVFKDIKANVLTTHAMVTLIYKHLGLDDPTDPEGDPLPPEVAPFPGEEECYSFTRDQLIHALTRLEVHVLPSGPMAGKMVADWFADALIEALEASG